MKITQFPGGFRLKVHEILFFSLTGKCFSMVFLQCLASLRKHLTISRQRRREYPRIVTETKSRWTPCCCRQTEKDNSIPFLDTSVIRDSNGLLTTSVYRKPTHTDQYLAYDSHHPQSVKRGIVKCLYDRAKHLITKPSVISEEKKHLSSVLVSK